MYTNNIFTTVTVVAAVAIPSWTSTWFFILLDKESKANALKKT